jgi:pimeloyl-ACP methyl ester carboxylesterase
VRRSSTTRSRARRPLLGGLLAPRAPFGVPHMHVWFDTADGVRLAGSVLGEPEGDTAVVLVHGFNGSRTKPRIRALAEGIARRFPVVAFDLRGHGQSGGACTGGELEPLDVHAAVGYARRRGFRRVVTVGASLGGIAVIRAAGDGGDADAVVAISTPAVWGSRDTPAVRRLTWLFTSPMGRRAVERLFGTRIRLDWGYPDPPLEAVARIRAPILIVHGADDRFFSAAQAEALYRAAPEPKRLLVLDRFGHAEDGFTPAFADRLVGEIEELLALAEPPRSAGP